MKYAFLTDNFNFTWEQLVCAFWQRYPNPISKHVLSEDTFYREVLPDGSLLSKRLIKKKNSVSIPAWGDKIAPKFVWVVEESIVDRKKKTLTTYTRNISATSTMLMEEKCTFKRDRAGTGVNLAREVFVLSPLRFIGSTIQSIGLNRYKSKTAPTSTASFTYVLKKMFRPWQLEAEEQQANVASKTKEILKEKYRESSEKLHESKEKLKESKDKSKEVLLLKKEKLKESAHMAKERAHLAKERSKETIIESTEKMKEKAKKAANKTKVFADTSDN